AFIDAEGAAPLSRSGREPGTTFASGREPSDHRYSSDRSVLVGEVESIDLCQPISPEDVRAIHAGMDRYEVLVFHDQPMNDEQQLAFTRGLGEIEHAIGT